MVPDSGDHCLSLLCAPDSPAAGADRGRQRIRFAIGRHHLIATRRTETETETTAATADNLYLPVPSYRGSPTSSAAIELKPDSSLAPAWVLPRVLRLHEASGQRGVAHLRSAHPLHLVDVHGRPLAPLVATHDGSRQLPYQPYALLSVAFA